MTEWIQFRRLYGLRSDREWATAVATRPQSLNDTGIPLLPYELAEIGRHNQTINDLVGAITAYGQTRPSAYAGTIVDEGRVVLLVAGPAGPHEAALEHLFPKTDGWAVRPVRWTLDELQQFSALVEEERPWFEANQFFVPDPAPDIAANDVLVDYLASSPDRGQLLLEHLGHPDWLRLRYEGPLPWDGPRGELIIRVVDQRGRPVKDLYCEAIPIDPSVNADDTGSFSTDSDGICRRRVPAAAYRLVVSKIVDGTPQPVGEGRATVSGDGVTRTTVRVSAS